MNLRAVYDWKLTELQEELADAWLLESTGDENALNRVKAKYNSPLPQTTFESAFRGQSWWPTNFATQAVLEQLLNLPLHPVVEAYVRYLGRLPDPEGMRFWLDHWDEQKLSPEQFLESFLKEAIERGETLTGA